MAKKTAYATSDQHTPRKMKQMADVSDEPAPSPAIVGHIGKYILVGLTYLDDQAHTLRQEQKHGVIIDATLMEITISLKGECDGQILSIPADPSAIEPADPGIYRLRSTNESVEDPDLLSTWTISKAAPTKAG